MLYELLLNYVETFTFLNVFKYLTFRTGLAFFTSLLITLLIGYFIGSSLGMVSAVVELMDPIAAFLSVIFIEILIFLRRNFKSERKKKFLSLILLMALRLL